MHKSFIFLIPIIVIGCTSNDDKPVRTWKGTTPPVSVSSLEKDIDPKLVGPVGDSFISHIGFQDIKDLNDQTKELLKNAGESGQPWQGVAGATKRALLISEFRKVGEESKSLAIGESKTRRTDEGAQAASRRVSAQLVYARCLLEDGDSKGAADAGLLAIEWCDKVLFDNKGITLWEGLHVLRTRTLMAVLAMCSNPQLKPEDKGRLAEAASKLGSMRRNLQEAICRTFSNELLVPNYNVTSLRSGKNIFQLGTKGDIDIKIASAFGNAALDGHKSIYNPHDVAKQASEYAMEIVKALDKPWPSSKIAIDFNEARATEVWGFNPFKMTLAQFKDKALQEKTKIKVATEKSPSGYLHVQVLTKAYRDAVPKAYAFDLEDSILLAGIIKASGSTLPLPLDPLTGNQFAKLGTTLKSTYVIVPDDSELIKASALKAYPY